MGGQWAESATAQLRSVRAAHGLAQLCPGPRSVRVAVPLHRQLGGAAERHSGRGHDRGLTGAEHGRVAMAWVLDNGGAWLRTVAATRRSDTAVEMAARRARPRTGVSGRAHEARRGWRWRRTVAARIGHGMPVGAGF
jgi:hypothetical protein